MGAILPDDIRNMDGKELKLKVETIYEYIKYMKDQLEWWGDRRQQEINNIQAIPSDTIDSIINT